MSRVLRVCLLPWCGLAVAGCLLPEFENGPAVSNGSGGGAMDAAQDSSVEVATGEDASDAAFDTGFDAEAGEAAADDVIESEPGFCELNGDGTICGVGDACNEMVCSMGVCVSSSIPDGVECADAPNSCWEPGFCQGGVCGQPEARPDGYNWDPLDTWKRCCGGDPLRMDTNANCGVCGITCDVADGQTCALNPVNGKYYCEGCNASAACWSGCCSQSYGEPYRCAASDCDGHCIACPAGAQCVSTPGEASLVCAYP